MAGCFLNELHARGEAEFGVDVGEVGLTVRGDTKSRVAMSLLPSPSLTRRTTSSSVGVSDAHPLAGRLRSPRPRCAWTIVIKRDGQPVHEERVRGWGESRRRMQEIAEAAAAGTGSAH